VETDEVEVQISEAGKVPYLPVPRGLQVPPTDEEKEAHCKTHMPFRPWCRLCCQAKARDQPHWQRPKHEGIPVVEMDFCYARTDAEQRARPVFMAVDAEYGSIYANLVEVKGRLDTMVIKGVLRWLLEIGRAGSLRLRTDPEPAMMAIAQAIARGRGEQTTVVETTPVNSKGSLGACERANQTFMGQLRTHKAEVEERLGIVLSMDDPLMTWLVHHVAWLHHRFNSVHGHTPFSRVQQREYTEEVYHFGQAVLVKIPDPSNLSKLSLRWQPGRWVGRLTGSDENIVICVDGVHCGRSARQIPEGEMPVELRPAFPATGVDSGLSREVAR
jgi:hypothetical protein